MSGVFMDGGNHDSVSHGMDHGHDHGGHDHGHHGTHHGHGQGGHSLIAQILGLDQNDHAHLAHHGGEGLAPSQSTSWNSALQALKLENLVAGINITPNFLLIMLFASFAGWLGVVYWIRHHEPFANQVLGGGIHYAPTGMQDRALIGGARGAMPFKTVPHSGLVYVPIPGENIGNKAEPGSKVNNSLSQAMSSAFGGGQGLAQSQAQSPVQPRAQAQIQVPVQASSPVNQSLSAAMAAQFGGGPQQAMSPSQGMTAPQSMGMSEQFSGHSASGAMGAQMAGGAPFSNIGGGARLFSARNNHSHEANLSAMGGLMSASGGARLFSNRGGMGSPAAMGAPMGAPPDSGMGARLFSSRRGMLAQAQQGQPSAQYPQARPAMPVQPAADPNVWSLATQGANSFSSDTAQFNAQFGAPLAK